MVSLSYDLPGPTGIILRIFGTSAASPLSCEYVCKEFAVPSFAFAKLAVWNCAFSVASELLHRGAGVLFPQKVSCLKPELVFCFLSPFA